MTQPDRYPPPPTITETLRLLPHRCPSGILLHALVMLRAAEHGYLEGYRVDLPRDPELTCAEHREAEMIAWLLYRHRWGWGVEWPAAPTCWCVGCCKQGHN